MSTVLFGRKKETPAEKEERLRRVRAEMQQAYDQGKAEYDKLCGQVQKVLETASKPSECNIVRFASAPYLFPQLKSYQYYTDWEIWRNGDTLYLYRAEVEDYPENYYDGDAPAIAQIPVSSIQHFRIEGSTYAESVISGGKVTQDRRTGKIKQTELKSKTVQHDSRVVRLSVIVNGVVKTVDFEYAAFDVFCALIPEKEHK